MPAQVLPPGRMSGIEEMLGENGEADDVVEDLNYVGERRREQKGRVDPALRDSLALLDSRMAEIESFGFNGVGRALTEEDRTIRLPVRSFPSLQACALFLTCTWTGHHDEPLDGRRFDELSRVHLDERVIRGRL